MDSAATNFPRVPDSGESSQRSGVRVAVAPAVLGWAIERSGKDPDALHQRFARLEAWERGEVKPTLRQVEEFAKATYVPIGYFFLEEPPVEEMPIPDLRTFDNQGVALPSANLLDTIYICQRRQDWYREYAIAVGEEPLAFIGSADIHSPVIATAAKMRSELRLNADSWRGHSDWEAAFRTFIHQVEDAGIMVMVNGVVGNNTHRRLEPSEFRGFTLADDVAPLVFINGADAKAAQMFTLAHELAHLWHGESALSDVNLMPPPWREIEIWCNSIAAELLLPLDDLADILPPDDSLQEVQNIRRRFKVSSLVVLRRLYEAGRLSDEEFQRAYELERQQLQRPQGGGGNFYPTLLSRVSHKFAQAILRSTLDGETLYRDAYALLGIRKSETFDELRQRLGY